MAGHDTDRGYLLDDRQSVSGPEQQLANRLRSGFRTLMAARGADLAYGPPTRRSPVAWRTSPPDGSIWPLPR